MTDIHIEQITQELTWRLRHDVLYPASEIAEMPAPEDDEGIHYGVFAGNKLAAVASVFAKGAVYEIRKLAIGPTPEPKRIGLTLLSYISQRSAESGAMQLWSDIRTKDVETYLESGFQHNGKAFRKNDMDYITVTKSL